MEADSDAGAPASKPKKPSKIQHVAAIRKNHLNIVFIGHVGKSLFDCLLHTSCFVYWPWRAGVRGVSCFLGSRLVDEERMMSKRLVSMVDISALMSWSFVAVVCVTGRTSGVRYPWLFSGNLSQPRVTMDRNVVKPKLTIVVAWVESTEGWFARREENYSIWFTTANLQCLLSELWLSSIHWWSRNFFKRLQQFCIIISGLD